MPPQSLTNDNVICFNDKCCNSKYEFGLTTKKWAQITLVNGASAGWRSTTDIFAFDQQSLAYDIKVAPYNLTYSSCQYYILKQIIL